MPYLLPPIQGIVWEDCAEHGVQPILTIRDWSSFGPSGIQAAVFGWGRL